MKLPSPRSASVASVIAGAAISASLAFPAFAANDPTPNPGDTAWLLTSSLLC